MLVPSQPYSSRGGIISGSISATLGPRLQDHAHHLLASCPGSIGSSTLAPGSILSGVSTCFQSPGWELCPTGTNAQKPPHTDETGGAPPPASGPLCTGCHNSHQAEELSLFSSFPDTIWRFCRQRSRTTSLYLSLLLPPWDSLQTAPGEELLCERPDRALGLETEKQ